MCSELCAVIFVRMVYAVASESSCVNHLPTSELTMPSYRARSSVCALPEPRDMCSCAVDPISHHFDLHASLTSLSSPLAAPSPCPFRPSKHSPPTLVPLDRRLAFRSQDTALISPQIVTADNHGSHTKCLDRRPKPETPPLYVVRTTRCPSPTDARSGLLDVGRI